MFLLSEIIYTDVFSDAIQPRRESGVPAEVFDGTIRTQPHLLHQIFGNFDVTNTTVDVGVEPGVVFGNQGRERFGIAFLGARDEVFVVES